MLSLFLQTVGLFFSSSLFKDVQNENSQMTRVDAIEEIQLLDSKFHRFNSKIPSPLSIFGSVIKRQELSHNPGTSMNYLYIFCQVYSFFREEN